jgi:hypothetical protein
MKLFGLSAAAAMMLLVAQSALGQCCASCGCKNAPEKTCRLVKTTKKIKVICYGCKSEDFCVPGRSQKCTTHCEDGACAKSCGCKTACSCDQAPKDSFKWTEWIPGCATMRTKKVLVKYEVTKEVPSYKWVVEAACARCCGEGATKEIGGAAAPIPPVPTSASIRRPVVVPVGTKLPPLPAGITAKQVRGVMFQRKTAQR